MILQCPKCKSIHIETKNYARKTGGTIGTVAGTTGGLAVGGGADLVLGELIDKNILNNLKCLSCGNSFSTDPKGVPNDNTDYFDMKESEYLKN